MRSPFSFLFRKKRSVKNPNADRAIRASALRSLQDDDNRDFFRGAIDKSADAICSDGERSRLRARCRKLTLDSPWAANLARSIALSTYGQGPTLQCRTANQELNNAIESAFLTWRRKTNYDILFLTAVQALSSDGECFFRTYSAPSGLRVELIEAWRIENDYSADGFEPDEFCGIKYDAYNEPVSYKIRNTSPNPNTYTAGFATVSADSIAHLFIPQFPGQRRGLPLLQSSLNTLASLRKLEDASLAAAETAANISFVISTKNEPNYDTEDGGDDRLPALDEVPLPIEKNTGLALPDNYAATQFKSENPNINLIAYQEACLLGVGASVGAPKNISLNDSSSYNYSSARLDAQLFERWTSVIQMYCKPIISKHLEQVILSSTDPVIRQWLLEGGSPTELTHDWYFPRMTHIDRKHEADADALLLDKGMLTLREYHARYGRDWLAEIAQVNREREMMFTRETTNE